jgi:hypothetical protein
VPVPDEIPVSNDELATVREAARGLAPLLRDLEAGRKRKVVLTQKGAMVGVIVTPAAYADMLRRQR